MGKGIRSPGRRTKAGVSYAYILYIALCLIVVALVSTRSLENLQNSLQANVDFNERGTLEVADDPSAPVHGHTSAGIGIDESQDDAIEIEHTSKSGHVIDFSHVFSSYYSDDAEAMYEQSIVRESWDRAARYAWETKGVRVEFVDAQLDVSVLTPDDPGMRMDPGLMGYKITDNIVQVNLQEYTLNTKQRRVPKVGDVFSSGISQGRGKWIVYTNADIGVVQDFYVRLWDAVETQDPWSEHVNRHLFNELVEYKKYCIQMKGCSQSPLCHADTRRLFEDRGGDHRLFKWMSKQVTGALLYDILARAFPHWPCQPSDEMEPVVYNQCMCKFENDMDPSELKSKKKREKPKSKRLNIENEDLTWPKLVARREHVVQKWFQLFSGVGIAATLSTNSDVSLLWGTIKNKLKNKWMGKPSWNGDFNHSDVTLLLSRDQFEFHFSSQNLMNALREWAMRKGLEAPYRFHPLRAAMTITRVDIPESAFKDMGDEWRSDPVLRNAIRSQGKLHPGNDCFVLPRDQTPQAIREMVHPVGLRPWGQWLPEVVHWNKDFTWRRIVGTNEEPYTFHVGIGRWTLGKSKDLWSYRSVRHKGLLLYLTSKWFNITGGRYGKVYDPPEYCSNVLYWREKRYCYDNEKAPHVKPYYCRGLARLGCARYAHPSSRDVTSYAANCRVISRDFTVPLVQPICTFCGFLYRRLYPDDPLGHDPECDPEPASLDFFIGFDAQFLPSPNNAE